MAPLRLPYTFPGTVIGQTVLLNTAGIKVGRKAVIAVTIQRELGNDLLIGAAVLWVSGPLLHDCRVDTGGLQHLLIVEHGYRVPIFG